MNHPADEQPAPQQAAKSSLPPPRSSAATQDAVIFGLLWLLVLLSGLFGVGATGKGVWLAYNGSRSATWPSVSGTIVLSRVTASEPRRILGRDTEPGYSADIAYQFRVGGSRYTGETIAFAIGSSHQSSAENRVRKYPLGMAVSVYYNPNDPTKSVLEPGYRREDIYMLLFVGILTLCFAVFMCWAITRGIPREAARLSAQQAAAAKDPQAPPQSE